MREEAVPMSDPNGTTILDAGEHRAVMTFNLKNGVNLFSWARRRRLLADVIRRAQPILLGTQEGYLHQLNYLTRRLRGYAFVGVSRYPKGVGEYSAILYDTRRVTIEDSGTVWLSATPDVAGSMFDTEHMPRIATWARCQVAGHDRPLLMMNTHLTYEPAGIDQQVGVLIDHLQRLNAEPVDTILTGDFNQPRHSRSWDRLVEIGFHDAWDIAVGESGPRITAHEWLGEPTDADYPERRIDWIMYRPADGQALPRECVVETIDTHIGRRYPSDHFPVVLRNRFRDAD
jgi:endonuclease/exonuclease/phosphatase family metal-dependent hydrolase